MPRTSFASILASVLIVGAMVSAELARAQTGDGKWFVTAQYGQADYEVSLEGGEVWWGDVDDQGDAIALGVGYHLLGQVGVRVMYERVGSIGATNRCPPDPAIQCLAISFEESTRTEQWSVVMMPRLEFGNGWALYGTVGAARWQIDPDEEITDDHGTDFLYGAGFGYRFAGGFGIGGEYQASDTEYQAVRVAASFEF